MDHRSEVSTNGPILPATDGPVTMRAMPPPQPDPEADDPGANAGRPDPVALGRLIERLRLTHGFTSRRQAAIKANLSDSYLGQVERGFVRRLPDGSVQRPNLDDGAALKIVWGWGLDRRVQLELFAAAGFDQLQPRSVPPRDELLKPGVLEGVLDRYSLADIEWLEETAAIKKLERKGRLRPRQTPGATEANGEEGDEDDEHHGSVGDAPSGGHAGPERGP
jgi:hypothetical protein